VAARTKTKQKAAKPAAARRKAAGVTDEAEATKAADAIKEELAQIESNEGGTVQRLVAIGVHLARLKAATRSDRDWTRRVKSIRDVTRSGHLLHPRTARRLMELGHSWWSENGTLGSDFVGRLPTDVQKLAWLCRLSLEQLGDLLDTMDCKAEGRRRVIEAVQVVLGGREPKKEAAPVPLEKVLRSFERAVTRVVTAVAESGGGAQDPGDVLARLRGVLDRAFAAGSVIPGSADGLSVGGRTASTENPGGGTA
jgi:hypothetical protein